MAFSADGPHHEFSFGPTKLLKRPESECGLVVSWLLIPGYFNTEIAHVSSILFTPFPTGSEANYTL